MMKLEGLKIEQFFVFEDVFPNWTSEQHAGKIFINLKLLPATFVVSTKSEYKNSEFGWTSKNLGGKGKTKLSSSITLMFTTFLSLYPVADLKKYAILPLT